MMHSQGRCHRGLPDRCLPRHCVPAPQTTHQLPCGHGDCGMWWPCRSWDVVANAAHRHWSAARLLRLGTTALEKQSMLVHARVKRAEPRLERYFKMVHTGWNRPAPARLAHGRGDHAEEVKGRLVCSFRCLLGRGGRGLLGFCKPGWVSCAGAGVCNWP
jgi:hypothetical protein